MLLVAEQTTATVVLAGLPTSEQATAVTTAALAVAAGFGIATAAATSDRLALTAHQGDADHREENRDAENQNTIHPSSSRNS